MWSQGGHFCNFSSYLQPTSTGTPKSRSQGSHASTLPQVIGDGILTPAQTVLGAFGALAVKAPGFTQSTIAGISMAVLALLFLAQPLGTHRIGSFYAPIMLIWFAFNAIVGIHNIHVYYPGIFKASPSGLLMCSPVPQ